ncbi:MAG: hypothetical protein RMK65_12770 [Anaerolineae bacterium]|nr:hypothetical protein [Anaerolineae bacterium]MCX8066430.1 hypothetical protein [Anaerolineae bacterium]MDW7992961.1 hypothetical protein [Anaerolineae bacterium]
MDPRTEQRLIEILETDPDFYVPIKKLWLMLQAEGLPLDMDLEKFQAWLEADDRFEIEDLDDSLPGDPEEAAELERELEEMGFFGWPRVKLASREMTAEDIFAGLLRSLERMNWALRGAWETRPTGDREMEAQLLDALALGEELEREVRELIEERRQEQSEAPVSTPGLKDAQGH